MKNLKHTPGPWKIIDDNITLNISTVKDDYNIAMVFRELEANAQLIATAPEMLEALILLFKNQSKKISLDYNIILKNAIEKATGKPIEEILS